MGCSLTGRRWTVAVIVAAIAGGLVSPAVVAQTPRPPRSWALRPPPERPPYSCCLEHPRAQRQGLADHGLGDGEPLSFLQHPAIVRADYSGRVRLRRFAVLGDYRSLRFERADTFAENGVEVETWERVGEAAVGGRRVSLFEPSWSAAILRRRLQQVRYGFDLPHLYWGQVVMPSGEADDATGAGRRTWDVYLRAATTGIPRSMVRRLAPDVQYASHVVNIVVPGFDALRGQNGTYAYRLELAAQRFFAHVADRYDSIAFVPRRSQLARSEAFHDDVKNVITGIGAALVDRSHDYGSGGRLKGVEVYHTIFGTNATSNHELAHQWGDEFDWATIAGIQRVGSQPWAHTPLLYPGETMIGAVLDPDVRVGRTEGGYQIERTAGRMRFHPLQRYRMGLLPPEQVPDVFVFVDQGQLADWGPAPPIGTPVTGETRRVTIDQIIAHHGPRTGPVARTWRRATVVVSESALATQAEMDYWNFLSRRLEDKSRTGTVSYDGSPSFDVLTARRVDLRTEITPRDVEAIVQPPAVDYPRFGRRDWPGITLDRGLPSRFRVDSRTLVTGRVAAEMFPGRVDWVLLTFAQRDEEEDLDYWAEVDSEGTFSLEIQPRPSHTGVYQARFYVFWTDAPPQWPRASVSPVVVD